MFAGFIGCTGESSAGAAYVLVEHEPFDTKANFTWTTDLGSIIVDPADGSNNLFDPNGNGSNTTQGIWTTGTILGTEKFKLEFRIDMNSGGSAWDYAILTFGNDQVIVSSGSANAHPELYGTNQISYRGNWHPVIWDWQVITVESLPNPNGTTATKLLYVDDVLIFTLNDIAISGVLCKFNLSTRSKNNLVFLDYLKSYRWA